MKLNLQALISLWLEQNFHAQSLSIGNNWTSLILEMTRADSGIDRLTIAFGESGPITDFSDISVVAIYESLFTDEQIARNRSLSAEDEKIEDIFSMDLFSNPEPTARTIWLFKLNVTYPDTEVINSFEDSSNLEIELDDYESSRLFFTRLIFESSGNKSLLLSEEKLDENGHIFIDDWSPIGQTDLGPEVIENTFEIDIEAFSNRSSNYDGTYGFGGKIIRYVRDTQSLKREINRIEGKISMLKMESDLDLALAAIDETRLKFWQKK